MVAVQQIAHCPDTFYVYVHRRASDGRVFYVGKGRGKRLKNTNRNRYWRAIVAKHGYTAEIIESGLTEELAFAREVALISSYGRRSLCNLTDGGEGFAGMSDASRQASIKKRTGLKRTPEQCARISASLSGRTISAEAARKVSEALKGRRPSDQTYEGFRRWLTPERNAERVSRMNEGRFSPVVCVETGVEFISITSALEWVRKAKPNARGGNITRCCKNGKPRAYGYTWRYIQT